jgi:hypothetical protein
LLEIIGKVSSVDLREGEHQRLNKHNFSSGEQAASVLRVCPQISNVVALTESVTRFSQRDERGEHLQSWH